NEFARRLSNAGCDPFSSSSIWLGHKKRGPAMSGEPSSAVNHAESTDLFGEEDIAKCSAHQFFEFFLGGVVHKNHLRSDFVRIFDRRIYAGSQNELAIFGDFLLPFSGAGKIDIKLRCIWMHSLGAEAQIIRIGQVLIHWDVI